MPFKSLKKPKIPLDPSECPHKNLRVSCMEQTTQNFNTEKQKDDGWEGTTDPIGEYYVIGASCRDCGQEEFTPQELANLTRLAVHEYVIPPTLAEPEDEKT